MRQGRLQEESTKVILKMRSTRRELKSSGSLKRLGETCVGWSTREDELMFWAVMTQKPLEDLRERVVPIRREDTCASYGSLNEIVTAKNWAECLKDFEWETLVMRAAMAGHDEVWLHQQFANWAEGEIFNYRWLEEVKRFEEDFCLHLEMGVPRRELYPQSF